MMEKDIKLLIYGSGNINPINIILENLRKYNNNYKIDGLNLYESIHINVSYKYFDKITRISKLPFYKIPHAIKKDLLREKLLNRTSIKFLTRCALRFCVKEAKRYITSAVEEAYHIRQFQEHFKLYDIIDVHWITEERANIVAQAPKTCKVILSFWGSDLMASAGEYNYTSLLKAINRADLITLSSIEMREIFLSKFGRHFKNKIRFTLYNQNKDFTTYTVDDIEKLRQVGHNLIHKQGFLTDDFRYVIKVGYSGFDTQNHLAILDQCFLLPDKVKEKLLLIVPMTYGASPEYTAVVEAHAQGLGLAACLLKEYLTKEEALSLSFICDIMLNLRDNDGFNNAMIETLMAGKILISGGWLPYSALRKNNVYFHEIYELNKISNLLAHILNNMEQELKRAELNAVKLKDITSSEKNACRWNGVYQEALLDRA